MTPTSCLHSVAFRRSEHLQFDHLKYHRISANSKNCINLYFLRHLVPAHFRCRLSPPFLPSRILSARKLILSNFVKLCNFRIADGEQSIVCFALLTLGPT